MCEGPASAVATPVRTLAVWRRGVEDAQSDCDQVETRACKQHPGMLGGVPVPSVDLLE